MKYIFDFDDVLFNNTTEFKKHMFKLIAEAGVPEEQAREYYLKVREKEFSLKDFIKHLFAGKKIDENKLYESIMCRCPDFLNVYLFHRICELGIENCYIITNGEKQFNTDKLKYSGILSLFDPDHIYIVPGTKKDVIEQICQEYMDEKVFFIEDKIKFMEDINMQKCPNLKTILYSGQELEHHFQ